MPFIVSREWFDQHQARVRSQRSQMRGDETVHRTVYAVAPTAPAASAKTTPSRESSAPIYPLVGLCRAAGLPVPVPEYRFHPARKWRADYAWPMHLIIVEIEGGAWTQGRHTRGAGYVGDMAKYNAATLLGYRVLRYTPQQLGQAITDLRIALAAADADLPRDGRTTAETACFVGVPSMRRQR